MVKRKIKRMFFALVFFLLIFLAVVQVKVVKAAVTSAISNKAMGPVPSCPPNVTGRLDYTETDKKGNKVEIWCDGGQYRLKFTRADGSVGYTGKCIYPYGQNLAIKTVNTSINTTASGTKIEVEEILSTFWATHDAPAPRLGVTGTNRLDRAWLYDSRTNRYIRQNTTHDGTWIISQDGKNLTYNITRVSPQGNPTPPQTPPTDPDLLVAIGDPSPDTFVLHGTINPEYELITAVPVTSIDEHSNIETNIFKIPYGKELITERIEAVVNQPFSFDVNMPGENIGLVTYSLAYSPPGMNINPNTGVINWMPGNSSVGYNNIALVMNYHDLTFYTEEFILPVLPDSDGDGIPDRDDYCDYCSAINLNKGWNLISIPLNLQDNSIESVFAPVMDKITAIYGFDNGAATYYPNMLKYSDLGNIDPTKGYWVKMNQSALLQVNGTELLNKSISLNLGWNLISYPLSYPKNITEILSGDMDKVVIVKGFENGALTFVPALAKFSNLKQMKPGHGYWINVNATLNLDF